MTFAADFVERIEGGLGAVADSERAVAMAAYMRNQFRYVGVPAPLQGRAFRAALVGLGRPTPDDLRTAARELWARPEREYQYAAASLLRRFVWLLDARDLALVRELITAKSWWDTVDALASRVVGPLVRAHGLEQEMDRWIVDENPWVARTALLYQLQAKKATDRERLFRYCLLQAGHGDFFIRKAIGWALRQYSWVEPAAVAAFVAEHEAELSPLSRREALLAISGKRKTPAGGT